MAVDSLASRVRLRTGLMLLDTCIVIDVLRGRGAALAFVHGLAEKPSLSAITATELIAGVRNARERRQIDRLLEVYTVHDIGLEFSGDSLEMASARHFEVRKRHPGP